MNTKRKSKIWVVITSIVISIITLVLISFGAVSFLLPPRNIGALVNSVFNKSNIYLSDSFEKWLTSGKRDYSSLPELLEMNTGSLVTDTEQFEQRKIEIVELFENTVYGKIPKTGFNVSYEKLEEGIYLNGKAKRKQIKITVTTDKGWCDAVMLMYLPVTSQPVGAVIGLNFKGNHTINNDKNIVNSYGLSKKQKQIESERGMKAGRWPIEMIIDNGFAVATMFYGDWAIDNKKEYNKRLISLFNEEEFKAISCWSFGIMRGIDYLMHDENIDNTRIADIGHSRLGKTALWAGANDDRIALVISNGSGNSGAALSRGNKGETIKYITTTFPYWFINKYSEYGRKENNLPLDQHMLLAAIAPKKLYVGNAKSDLWADPQGSFNSLQLAKPAFALYGKEVISDTKNQPDINVPLHTESMGYHLRKGGHDINEIDWKYYLEYMQTYL